MKKTFLIFISVICILSLLSVCAAEQKTSDPLRFKHEYELLNGQMDMQGTHEYQIMEIPEDNPIVYAQLEDITALFNDGSGVLYLGFPECPWCRTLLPVLLEAAENSGYEGNIYYYNALYDRNMLSLDENGEIIVEEEGTEAYQALLKLLDEYLLPYEGLNDPSVKRVYFPMTVFVKDGRVLASHISTVDSQDDGFSSLTHAQRAELLDLLRSNFEALTRE